jgi:hypothetical protein
MANQGHPYVVVGEHYDGVVAHSSVQRRAVETVTQRALESINDAIGSDENYHAAKQDRADLRAELVIADEKVAETAFLRGLMRTARREAVAAVLPAQEVYDMDREHTVARVDLALVHAEAQGWTHFTGPGETGPLELYSLAQRIVVDCINHPIPCARSVRAGRVGLHNGNHRVGPTVTRLHASGFMTMRGNGNNRVSGLDPAFGSTLALTPRFDADLNDSSGDEA